MASKKSILYITYDGLMEPLGQSQVLSYQERLSNDHDIHILSFEKPRDLENKAEYETLCQRLKQANVHWHPARYHKKPSAIATAWDILWGILVGLFIIRKHRISIVHARSYVPSVMALALKKLTGVKYIFDMRGFWADERVDGNLWPRNGRMYRVAKWFERRFLLNADHVVSLTNAAVREIEKFDYLQGKLPPMTTITTCANLSLFTPQAAPQGDFVLGYVGSAGTWYLFDQVLRCFKRLLHYRPEARLHIVNRNEHEYIRKLLQQHGISSDIVELQAASHATVPLRMARMHAAIFFIKPTFSKLASAPTRLGEFLGCGVPCLTNAGVGDVAEIVLSENVGVALSEFSDAAFDQALEQLLDLVANPTVRDRCVSAARRHFHLDEGVKRYRKIYQSLLEEA